jgi:Transcription factor zinc-finger
MEKLPEQTTINCPKCNKRLVEVIAEDENYFYCNTCLGIVPMYLNLCNECQERYRASYNNSNFVCPKCVDKLVNYRKGPTVPQDPPLETLPPKAKSDKVGTGLLLIPLYSLLAVGKIFIEGLRYGKDNWKKGVHDKEYQEERLEHAFLHLIKYKEGDRSEEHLAKVAWFCFTQLELERLEQNAK